MARCILHVGMHKTGSSSIQATLDRVDLPGVAVLQKPHSNQSGPIRAAFDDFDRYSTALARTKGPGASDGLAAKRGRFRASITEFLASNADRDVIVSAEGFDNLTSEALQDFLGLVPHKEVKVIAYIRAPHGHMESALQQRIKAGATDIPIASPVPRYDDVLSKYQAPGLDFEPVLFDKGNLRNGCVVQDFFSRIGHEISPGEVQISNEGISQDAVSLILLMNKWRARQGLLPLNMNPLISWLRTIKGPKLTIHPEVFELAAKPHRESISWVEDLLDHKFTLRDALPNDIRSLSEILEPSDAAISWVREQGANEPDVAEAMNAASTLRLSQRAPKAAAS